MIIFGAGLASLAVRVAPPAVRSRAAFLVGTGALGACALAAIQTGAVVLHGLQDGMQSITYFYFVTAVIIVAVVAGMSSLFQLALSRRPTASIAATFAALSLAIWIGPSLC